MIPAEPHLRVLTAKDYIIAVDGVSNSVCVYDSHTDDWSLHPREREGFDKVCRLFPQKESLNQFMGIVKTRDTHEHYLVDYDITHYIGKRLVKLPESHQVDWASAVVSDDKLYVLGGREPSTYKLLDAISVFNLHTMQWSSLSTQMPTARYGCSVFIGSDSTLYVGGGVKATELDSYQPSLEPCSDFQALSLKDLSWRFLKPTSAGRAQFVCYYDQIIATGGFAENFTEDFSDRVSIYDSKLDEWLDLSSMNAKRVGHGLCVFNNELVAIGGKTVETEWEPTYTVEAIKLQF